MTLEQFIDRLNESYTRFSSSETDQPSACLCLMLDQWDRIRTQHGYTGLVRLTGKLRLQLVEHIDVEALVCPLNERSLLCLLPQCTLRTAEKQAARLFSLFDETSFSVGEESMMLSISLGYVEFDHRFTSADQLLLRLIKSTEQISNEGGNEVCRIEPDVSAGQAASSDRQMLGLLMESLRKDEIKVLFQPLMSTAGEPSQSFQALPRLVAADGSLITAASFVQVAHDGGVLGVLDRWMIKRVIYLLTHDYHLQPIKLFLTQGDSLLVNSERRDWFVKQLEQHRDVSGKLVLDFALDDAVANLKGASAFLALAHKHGIEVCFSRVDDHSKWDLLADGLTADFLKMSPSFVRRLGDEAGLDQQFSDLSRPVREKGTKIIMPMVEDASIAANLWRTGADYMQGYMIQEARETIDLSD